MKHVGWLLLQPDLTKAEKYRVADLLSTIAAEMLKGEPRGRVIELTILKGDE